MKPANKPTATTAGLTALCFSFAAHADWSLNNDKSRLSFVSIKKDSVAEVHKFTQLSGSVREAGQVNVEIQLASIDSGIEIRDERMRSMLFDTNTFPKATISGTIDPKMFNGLRKAEMDTGEIELQLSMHGHSAPFAAKVSIVKLQNDGLMVTTIEPIIIKAADYGMEKGVEQLRDVVNLPAINSAVPVTLSLVFESKG